MRIASLRGSRDRLGLADTEGDPSVERAERGLGAPQVHGGEAQDRRRPVGGRLSTTAQEASTRHLVVGREGEPGGEVFLRRPAGHLGANFGEEAERVIGADAVQL